MTATERVLVAAEKLLPKIYPIVGNSADVELPAALNELEIATAKARALPNERMRYLGVLALLAESSLLLRGGPESEDFRESIERAIMDACADGSLTYRRMLDRFEIEPVP